MQNVIKVIKNVTLSAAKRIEFRKKHAMERKWHDKQLIHFVFIAFNSFDHICCIYT